MVGERLRSLRKRKRLTQQELAQRVSTKIDYSYVGKIERGDQNPSLRTLRDIARALEVPVGFFFAEKGPERLRYDVASVVSDRAKSDLMKETLNMEDDDVVFLTQVARLLRTYRRKVMGR